MFSTGILCRLMYVLNDDLLYLSYLKLNFKEDSSLLYLSVYLSIFTLLYLSVYLSVFNIFQVKFHTVDFLSARLYSLHDFVLFLFFIIIFIFISFANDIEKHSRRICVFLMQKRNLTLFCAISNIWNIPLDNILLICAF